MTPPGSTPAADNPTSASQPLLFRGAFIFDGTGADGFVGDLLVRGSRLAAVGGDLLEEAAGARVIEADGLYACPGFVDPHGHSDLTLLADPRGLSKLAQGITTEACGQCGMSPFPVPEGDLEEFRGNLSYIWAPVELTWRDAHGYLAAARAHPRGINLCPFFGANTAVMVHAARGNAGEAAGPLALGPADLSGLWGLSLGIAYEPLLQWDTEGLLGLVPAARGKMVSVHMRNEGSRLLESIQEVLEFARRAPVRVEIAHLKAAVESNWGKMAAALDLLEEAHREGLPVGFNAYPYTAGSTFLAATLPSWLIGKGHARGVEMLRDPSVREKLRVQHRQGKAFFSLPPDKILIASAPTRPEEEGLLLSEIAQKRRVSPFDAAVDVLIENRGEVTAVFFTMSEDDVRLALAHPLGSVCTDGLAVCPDGPTSAGKPHPRCYGAFPRFLGRYVRDERLVSWPEAIRKTTSLPARRLGLTDRGVLREGGRADVVLFDPQRIRDRADYGDPHHLAEGVEYVVVNGVLSIAEGKFTGALGGQILSPSEVTSDRPTEV